MNVKPRQPDIRQGTFESNSEFNKRLKRAWSKYRDDLMEYYHNQTQEAIENLERKIEKLIKDLEKKIK